MAESAKISLKFELLLLLILATLWGSSYLFINVALRTIPPVTLISIRLCLSGLLLYLIMRLRGYRFPTDRETLVIVSIQSAFGAGLAWLLLAWGQQYVPSSLASVLNSTTPIFVFFATWLFTRHEETNLRRLSGALLGMIGVIMVMGFDALYGLGDQLLPQIAIALGAMCYAFASIWGQKLTHLSPIVASCCVMSTSAIWVTALAFVVEDPLSLSPSLDSVLAALALTLFSTVLAVLIFYRLLRTLGSLGTTSQAYLRGGIGLLLGVVILGEQLHPSLFIGLFTALIGIALINWPTKTKKDKKITN